MKVPTDCSVFVMDEAYLAGPDWGGEQVYGLKYFVVLEFPDGFRLRHNATFYQYQQGFDEDGEVCHHQTNAKERAEALANRVSNYLASCATKNIQPLINKEEHWYEIDPAYGSEAYQHFRIEDQRWNDERNSGGF